MSRVKGADTSPEMLLRSALWHQGLRYRLKYKVPAGRPDLVFPGPKVAVTVDGCFWHGCPEHYSRPKSREDFWAEKLAANTERDSRLTLRLESVGWTMVRIWEHEILRDTDRVVRIIREAIEGRRSAPDGDWRVVRVDPVEGPDGGWERRELRMLRRWDRVKYETGPRITGSGKDGPGKRKNPRGESGTRNTSGNRRTRK